MRIFATAAFVLLLPVSARAQSDACTTDSISGAIVITSHTNLDIVDTSEAGLGTGSFFLSGTAPPDTTDVTVSVEGESIPALITNLDACQASWSLELAPPETTTETFSVVATTTGQTSTQDSVILQVIAPSDQDNLVQPAFAFTPQSHDLLIGYDASSGNLTFQGDLSGSIKAGAGLAADASDMAPNGYLRIVLDSTYSPLENTTVVTTRQAGMLEFIRQASFSTNSTTVGGQPVVVEEQDLSDLSGPIDAVEGGRRLLKLGENTELNFTRVLKPTTPKFDLDIGLRRDGCFWCLPTPYVEEISMEVGLEYGFTVDFKHTLGSFTSDGKQNFGRKLEKRLARIRFPLGGIPVTVDFELAVQPFYEFDISAEFSISYDNTWTYKAGFEYFDGRADRGAYTDGPTPKNGNAAGDVSTELGVDLKGGVGLEIDLALKLYGQAGPEIDISPKLDLVAESTLHPVCEVKWELGLEVPIKLGFDIDIDLGPINYEREFDIANLATFEIPLSDDTVPFTLSELCKSPSPTEPAPMPEPLTPAPEPTTPTVDEPPTAPFVTVPTAPTVDEPPTAPFAPVPTAASLVCIDTCVTQSGKCSTSAPLCVGATILDGEHPFCSVLEACGSSTATCYETAQGPPRDEGGPGGDGSEICPIYVCVNEECCGVGTRYDEGRRTASCVVDPGGEGNEYMALSKECRKAKCKESGCCSESTLWADQQCVGPSGGR